MFRITPTTVTVTIAPEGPHGPQWIAENLSHHQAISMRHEFLAGCCRIADEMAQESAGVLRQLHTID